MAHIEAIEPSASATQEWTFAEAGTSQLTRHVRDHDAHWMAITIGAVK